IWIHAVSLGEVKVASSIINALRQILPTCSVIVSTNTKHGRELATETFGDNIDEDVSLRFPIWFCNSLIKVSPPR
ncbi:MAG: hypothetical protein IMF19_05440, partial [Proteobacteria bacterium]|nr:hypothetical protein [Pseudomonadota bacterium]